MTDQASRGVEDVVRDVRSFWLRRFLARTMPPLLHAGWSHAEFARRSGVPAHRIGLLLRGAAGPKGPTVATLDDLTAAIDRWILARAFTFAACASCNQVIAWPPQELVVPVTHHDPDPGRE